MPPYENGFIVATEGLRPSLPRLSLVVPCFNEEEIIEETVSVLCDLLARLKQSGLIHADSILCCIDDGSNDNTWPLLCKLTEQHAELEVVALAANVGHQKALLAGMMHVRSQSDCCITLDADLQDDITVIKELLQNYHLGNDIVLGVRRDRSADHFAKRITAQLYYSLQTRFGIKVIPDHADFRLLSARSLAVLALFGERNLYLRGLVTDIGLPMTTVHYERKARIGGTPKYDLQRMLNLAVDGITSFTSRPLRLLFFSGLFVMGIALLAGIYIIVRVLAGADVIPGWASLAVLVIFLGGCQLLAIGVVGEYIGKIYIETKSRPMGVIRAIQPHKGNAATGTVSGETAATPAPLTH